MPDVHLNDTDFFYVKSGQGIPCLVMHGGLGFDHTGLYPWLNPLGGMLHLVYYDHRGNGRSGRPPLETLTHDQFCADADALRSHFGFAKMALFGHSYGGFLALEYALRYPERLTHLILSCTAPALNYGAEVDANAKRKGETDEERAIRKTPPTSDADMKYKSGVRMPLYFYKYDKNLAERVLGKTVYSASAARRALELRAQYNVTPHLQEIRTPTLILAGRDDFICPPSQAQIMHAGIPNSEMHIFEQSGHFPFVEESEPFFQIIRDWVRKTV